VHVHALLSLLVACLRADARGWRAWRNRHGARRIPSESSDAPLPPPAHCAAACMHIHCDAATAKAGGASALGVPPLPAPPLPVIDGAFPVSAAPLGLGATAMGAMGAAMRPDRGACSVTRFGSGGVREAAGSARCMPGRVLEPFGALLVGEAPTAGMAPPPMGPPSGTPY